MVLVRDLSLVSAIVVSLIFIWLFAINGGPSTTSGTVQTQTGVSSPVNRLKVRSLINPMLGMAVEDRIDFRVGESFFSDSWLIAPSSTSLRDGLGPYFNARSCLACHVRGGRSDVLSEEGEVKNAQVRLARLDVSNHAGSAADPVYGRHLHLFAVPHLAQKNSLEKERHLTQGEARVGIKYEYIDGEYDDGESYQLRRPKYQLYEPAYGELHQQTTISFRVAPALAGAGLLEAIPDETLIKIADPDDSNKDGISGRVNYVFQELEGYRQEKRIGRFGHKAHHASIISQTAAAFRDDIGITNTFFPQQACTAAQLECAKVPSGINPGDKVEIKDDLLEKVSNFIRLLAPPHSTASQRFANKTGRKLFQQAQCSHCHTPAQKTKQDSDLHLLSDRTFYPYTDLLLHDMGEDLADHQVEYEAGGSEWRTAPLWGLSTAMRLNSDTGLLHDGRARDISEAILWHGGEAEVSKRRFLAMSKSQRQALIDFVAAL